MTTTLRNRRRRKANQVNHLWLIGSVFLVVASVLPTGGTQIRWTGNENVSPKQQAAHDAPRSQKYWDEHGIERPDYAKTDAEIAAERRPSGKTPWRRWMGIFIVVMYSAIGALAISAIVYGITTGDWGIIMKNPATKFIDGLINRIVNDGRIRGQRLGSSIDSKSSKGNFNEDEKQRLARLARFETPQDLLDDLKED